MEFRFFTCFAAGVITSAVVLSKKRRFKVSDDPWKLLTLASSDRWKARLEGLSALASKEFPVWLAIELAQACSPKTLLGLCRLGSKLPYFAVNTTSIIDFDIVYEKIWFLLHELLKEPQSNCAKFHTEVALNRKKVPVTNEEEILWGSTEDLVDVSEFYRSRPDLKRLLMCMEALNAQAKISRQSRLMVKRDIMSILKSIWNQFEATENPTEVQLKHLTLRILSNIALAGATEAEAIISGGWLKVLGNAVRATEQLDLHLLALKVLSNLDYSLSHGLTGTKYEEGVYLIHPTDYGLGRDPGVDLIFIHGLRGGVFKTWRQKDLRITKKGKREHKTVFDTHDQLQFQRTQCWPKDWLPKDLAVSCRILGVDYTTYLSDWKRTCPEESKLRTIKDRSDSLKRKLLSAGVGCRPIVWVCHSMGGLVVKQLLTDMEAPDGKKIQNSDCLLRKTIGCVFFATPHFGSPVASQSMARKFRYILQPSIEVGELTEGNENLVALNSRFRIMATELHLPCLTVVETEKTSVKVAGFSYKALLVPQWSADLGFGELYKLKESHLATCKPESKNSVVYRIFLDFIHKLC